MIDIDEDTYYVGIWFLASKLGQDMMAIVFRKAGEDHFRLSYRFRYYADPEEKHGFDPFDDKDTKRFYNATCPPEETEDHVIMVVDEMLDELVENNWCGTRLPWKVRTYRHKNLCRGNGKAFGELLASLPYTHFRVPTEEERKQMIEERHAGGKPHEEA